MSAEVFQVIDEEKIDSSFNKRDFSKINYQQGPQVDDENQSIIFFYVEILDYIHVGIGYREVEVKVRNTDNSIFILADDNTNEIIRLFDYAFAITLHEARISSSSGTVKEQKKFVGDVWRTKRFLTHRTGDLSTDFDIIDESGGRFNNSSLKQILFKNHTEGNRGSIEGHMPLEYIFRFCKTIKKISKGLGFDL